MIEHKWNIAPEKAVALQRKLAGRIRVEPLAGPIRLVAGTDCTYSADDRRIVASAVLCDARTWEVLERVHVRRPCEFPYVPGLLSFREAPATIEAVQALTRRPDLVLCDGQGLAHPRRLGLACHVGLWLDVPTIGVAKSLLCGEYREPGCARGCRTQLRHKGEVVGLALRTQNGVNVIYVSAGHRITLPEAGRWALRAAKRYRVPEPTRQAHIYLTTVEREP